MPHDRLGSGTEKNTSQTRPAMRRNYYQVNFTFLRNAHNLRGRFAMND